MESIGYEYLLYKNRIVKLTSRLVLEEIRAVGGGAKPYLWNQIKSDILGINYKTITREDNSLLGQALIGAKAAGYIDNVSGVIDKIVKVKKSYKPKSRNKKIYEKYFEKYVKTLTISFS